MVSVMERMPPWSVTAALPRDPASQVLCLIRIDGGVYHPLITFEDSHVMKSNWMVYHELSYSRILRCSNYRRIRTVGLGFGMRWVLDES